MVRDILARNGMPQGLAADDVVAVTRGPGMIGSLSAGYNLAKGLAVAWRCGFVGVHHMVGHLLTPRFFVDDTGAAPQYPFVSLLVSGGHTMLVLSQSVTQHTVLANTVDIAIGDMLDKCARELGITGSMLGMEMEKFINSSPQDGAESHHVPDEFVMPNPLQNKGSRVNLAAYSFAAFITALRTAQAKHFGDTPTLAALPAHTRREIARRVQTAIFVHLATKTALALRQQPGLPRDLDFVCAGGVAANADLRRILARELDAAGFGHMRRYYPAAQWCTDNAAMVGWAGIEMWEAGWQTDLSALPTAKWGVEDLLSLGGWTRRED